MFEAKIDTKKCRAIYDALFDEHSEKREGDYWPLLTTGARELDFILWNMWNNGEITYEEHMYIFGLLCSKAMHGTHGDFFRVE